MLDSKKALSCSSLYDGAQRVLRDDQAEALLQLALDILRGRHEAAGKPKKGLVFPSPRAGKAIDTFTKIKAALAKADPGLTGWRFHDARRSFASWGCARRLSEVKPLARTSPGDGTLGAAPDRGPRPR